MVERNLYENLWNEAVNSEIAAEMHLKRQDKLDSLVLTRCHVRRGDVFEIIINELAMLDYKRIRNFFCIICAVTGFQTCLLFTYAFDIIFSIFGFPWSIILFFHTEIPNNEIIREIYKTLSKNHDLLTGHLITIGFISICINNLLFFLYFIPIRQMDTVSEDREEREISDKRKK